ncbi:hypothetical protein BST97_13985 [Nonlabens spongiae]|uniref:Tetratricopeptide repeat protein n=1 Tax=Nonlabens spongiae TaxID=331648 RepID=A0A1W6MN38_9FLAO|nr:hypothetical protein [Nonlabens spongiae]ARN79008.1 hypothetical protein BST97_13985 [Nonlabens spongiae]
MERLQHLFENPQEVTGSDLSQLAQIVDEHPYFQAARSLYLKCLKLENSPQYNRELQKTAAITTDRSVLFDFITSPEFIQDDTSKSIKQNQLNSIKVDAELVRAKSENLDETGAYSKVNDPELFKKKENKVDEQPLDFSRNDVYSFSEWLKLTSLEPVEKTSATQESEININEELRKKKMARIDRFLADKPKIKPAKGKVEFVDIEIENPAAPLMTETLAGVYMAQKNYAKAIKSYEILILQHPEKSSFFADQIQKIKDLQSNS